MSGMGFGGYEAMERRERMDSGTTSENTTFKPISVTAAEAWVREVGLAKMPVPSVSLDDVKRAFVEGYELANAVRERESLLLQAELRESQIEGPRLREYQRALLWCYGWVMNGMTAEFAKAIDDDEKYRKVKSLVGEASDEVEP